MRSTFDDRPFLGFSTFAQFAEPPAPGSLPRGQGAMCGITGNARRMPAAEQTLKVLWQSDGRPHYFGQVPGAFGDCRLTP